MLSIFSGYCLAFYNFMVISLCKSFAFFILAIDYFDITLDSYADVRIMEKPHVYFMQFPLAVTS
jgi:hypothetical protein